MQAFRAGQRPATVMDRVAKGFSDAEIAGHRRLVRAQQIETRTAHDRHRTCRRTFLTSAAALAASAAPFAAARPRAGRAHASWWSAAALPARAARARSRRARSAHRSDAGRGEPDLHRLPVQQRRDRRIARSHGAAFGYDNVAADGIDVVDSRRRRRSIRKRARSRSATAQRLSYDRLVLAPGIDLRWDALPGYTEAAAEKMPHAWKAGDADVAAAPPARGDGGRRRGRHCGAGQPLPLPARPLRAREPDRVLSQDEKAEIEADRARRQGRLFQAAAVSERLGGALSRTDRMGVAVGGRQGHVGRARDARRSSPISTSTRRTSPTSSRRRRRARIAEIAGVADRTGWCPIDPVTFESKLQPNIHVIGDAAIAGAMPKSAFAANAQAKVCAAAMAKLLAARRRPSRSSSTPATAWSRRTTGSRSPASISPVERQSCRYRGRGRRRARSTRRAPMREARSEIRGWLVQDNHRRSLRLSMRRARAVGRARARCCCDRPRLSSRCAGRRCVPTRSSAMRSRPR